MSLASGPRSGAATFVSVYQVVAGRDLHALVVETLLEGLALRLEALARVLEGGVLLFVLEADLEPLFTLHGLQVVVRDHALELVRATDGLRTNEHAAHALEQVVLE